MAKITPRVTVFNGTEELNIESISFEARAGAEGYQGSFVILSPSLPLNKGDVLTLKYISDDFEGIIAEIEVTDIVEKETDFSHKEYEISFKDTFSARLDDEISLSYWSLTGAYTVSQVANDIVAGTGYTFDVSAVSGEDYRFREFQSHKTRRDALNLFERVFGCVTFVDYAGKELIALETPMAYPGTVTPLSKRTKFLSPVSGVRLYGALNSPPVTTLASTSKVWNLMANKWAVHAQVSGNYLTGYCRATVTHPDFSNVDGAAGIQEAKIDGVALASTVIFNASDFEALTEDTLPKEDFVVVEDQKTISIHRYINIDISGFANKDSAHLAAVAKKTAACVFEVSMSGTATYIPAYYVEVGVELYTPIRSDDPSSEAAATRVASLLFARLSATEELEIEVLEDDFLLAGMYVQLDGKTYKVTKLSVKGNPIQITATLRG